VNVRVGEYPDVYLNNANLLSESRFLA
jgi:hypothetical protein